MLHYAMLYCTIPYYTTVYFDMARFQTAAATPPEKDGARDVKVTERGADQPDVVGV